MSDDEIKKEEELPAPLVNDEVVKNEPNKPKPVPLSNQVTNNMGWFKSEGGGFWSSK